MTLAPAEADKILTANFAPWVLDLGLTTVELDEGRAVLRLPWSDRLAREGGALSGQALMAAADTATVITVSAARGSFVPMTTVHSSRRVFSGRSWVRTCSSRRCSADSVAGWRSPTSR